MTDPMPLHDRFDQDDSVQLQSTSQERPITPVHATHISEHLVEVPQMICILKYLPSIQVTIRRRLHILQASEDRMASIPKIFHCVYRQPQSLSRPIRSTHLA